MRAQTLRAVDEADLIVFVVDAIEGITAVDEDVARVLRRSGKPVLIAANKIDSARREVAVAETFALGFEQVFPISASHGRGIGELLDAVVKALGARARTGRARRRRGGRRRGATGSTGPAAGATTKTAMKSTARGAGASWTSCGWRSSASPTSASRRW